MSSTTPTTDAHLTLDLGAARAAYGRAPFRVGHDLADHPLFGLEALAELAERVPLEHIEHNAGNRDVLVADNDALAKAALSPAEIIRRIGEQPGFVALPTTVPGVPRQPGYQELFEALLEQLAPVVGVPAGALRDHHAMVFIASGGNTTPVHVDPEPSFLLHLRGAKRFSIGRHPDPAAEQAELEAFYRHEGRNSALVPVDLQDFDLAPGQGLHVPPVQPHWVENGPEVTVSFSIGFQTRADHLRRGVYQFNGRVRKLGLTPKPYGANPRGDRVKGSVMGAAFEARRRLLRRPA